VKLHGKIFSGMGVGQEYLSLDPYQRKIKDITGFEPFPGTLNLRCNQKDVEKVMEDTSERIQSFKFEGGEYTGLDVYECKLQGVEVAVLRMDLTDYGPEVVEVVAEQNLREKFGLEDGDEVELFF